MLRRLLKDRRLVQGYRSMNIGTSPQSFLAISLLKTRSILKVSGEDGSNFMQGLITNDMRHLEDGACSMYTMFLNTKGRVMYDAIIYGKKEDGSFLVECDQSALPALQKHLSLYRIRRKIKIDNLDEDINVWVLFNPKVQESEEVSTYVAKKKIVGEIVSCSVLDDSETLTEELSEPAPVFKKEHNLLVCRDPRLSALGYRILAPKRTNVAQIAVQEAGAVSVPDQSIYKLTRYKLGVGEGVEDLPPGKTFPLEANCDYLHGVSFHKGCYIGQELTARTHHTGVIRKRLMPLAFDSVPTAPFTPDASIELGNNSTRSVGKLRGFEKTSGLALLRIAEALDATEMTVLGGTCHTRKPFWWPQEAPKERISITRETG